MTSLGPGGEPVRGLWFVGQFLNLCALQCLAILALGVSWYGSSRTGHLSTQVDWVVLAVGGLTAAVLSSVSWLLLGRRRIGLRRTRLMSELESGLVEEIEDWAQGTDLVAAASMTHYHRPSCQLVRGKSPQIDALDGHLRAARTPCAVCRP